MIIQRIKKIYAREIVKPSLVGIFINPFYFIKKGLYRGVASNKTYMKGKLLDFGCGSKPFKELFNVTDYIGLDIEVSGHPHKNSQVDVFYNGKTIPFEDNYFDSIFSSEVFEHVFNLDQIIPELYRVIKPGGHMLITLPFVWDEHEIPYDFARYTSFGIAHLLKKNGFEVIAIEKTTNYVETVFQMWSAYITQHVLPSNRFFRMLMTPLLIAPVTISGIIASKILPTNKNFYHNNIVIAKKRISSN